MFQLQLFDTKSGARRAVPVTDAALVIGSAIDCDLVLPGGDVAPKQCRVESIDGALRVVDLGTDHETLLNDRAVGRATLNVGDVLRIGGYQITVLPAPVSAPIEPPASAAPVAATPAPSAARARPAARPAPREERAAPRGRTQKSSSAGTLIGVMAVIGMIIVAFVLFTGGDDDSGSSALLNQQQIAKAIELNGQCRFDEALTQLAAVIGGGAGPEKDAALEQERLIKLRKQRYADGKNELDVLRRRAAADLRGDSIGDLNRFVARNSDLAPLADQGQKLVDELEIRSKQPTVATALDLEGITLPAQMTVANCVSDANGWLAKQEFGKAHFILSRVEATSEAEKKQLAEAFTRVNSAARKVGEEILARVKEQLEAGQALVAIGEFDDDNMRPFKGTDIWYEMLDKADEIEDIVDKKFGNNRPFPRRKHHREKPGSEPKKTSLLELTEDSLVGRKPVAAADGAAAESSTSPALRSTTSPLQEQARALLAGGDFEGARARLEQALDTPALGDSRGEIARDHERAARPLKLATRVTELLATKVPTHAEVKLRDGRRGRLLGSDGRLLSLQVGAETLALPAIELDAASLLSVSSRLPLEGEEQLNRAFLALAVGATDDFFGALSKVGNHPEWQGSIDSALAFQRGLDRVPPRGFVRTGDRWLTWEEQARESLANEIRVALTAALSGREEPSVVRRRILELAAAAPAIAIAELKGRRLKLKADFEKAPEQPRLAKLHERAVTLHEARRHALELIFDEEKYFYPYHPPGCSPERAQLYPAVQQEVDLRVDAVRAYWGKESDPPPDLQVAIGAALSTTLEQLQLVRAMLSDLGAANDEVDQELRPAWSLPLHARAVSVRNFALDEYERARLDLDAKVWILNGSVAPRDDGPTREEIEQVRVTNLYRVMLGRRVLALNEKLWKAADSHSEWMARNGQLSHFEEGDAARYSPELRMKQAGYVQGAGENCAVGSSGPLEVLDGWCHSSGHHRNLLYESHTEMGAGQSGSYWTQCFGGGREYKGNLIRD